ncbi:hypothetical protein ASA1KI_20840 [Opitutales bacterium ASA1]|uniref:hypothetical protein n=1 Tax=Congregicoccus parvus TaxID=3081749 RepID=UPI002B293791|nr:hypothetical protein ASA1KI_20840 [Opitutales bacterium ASA1]
MNTARTGKIGRCPAAIREEVNRRLLDGQPASKILPWLNSQEDVLRVLDEHFGEEPVTPQNLSEWRQGGYKEWLGRREKVEQLRELSAYAAQLGAAAGGGMHDGSAAILGGRIMQALETAIDADPTATAAAASGEEDAAPALDLAGLVDCVVKLRASDLDVRRTKQRDRLLDQRERAVKLAEAQFQVKTAEAFLRFYEDRRAKEIAEGSGEPRLKIAQLRELMFGKVEGPDADAQ